jgi:hypothetical protein
MAKKIVKNSSSQPLYFNLPGGRSLKIPARSQAEVDEADLNSDEMALHQSRGNITLMETAAEGENSAAQDEKSETKAEANPQPAGKAKDEGGKD